MYVPSKENPPKHPVFSSWNFKGVKGKKSQYHGLFPQAWTVYDGEPDPDLKLTCHQVSPVIPNDYKRSSYPCGVFVWTVQNTTDKIKNVSLMFTFQNGDGSDSDANGGHYNEVYRKEYLTHEIVGIRMQHNSKQTIYSETDKTDITFKDPVSLMISTKIDYDEFGAGVIESTRNVKKSKNRVVTYCGRFETNNEDSLKFLWNQFKEHGRLNDDEDTNPSAPGQTIGAALCVSDRIEPHSSITIKFSLAWDAPVARFSSGNHYFRRYTDFFSKDGHSIHQITATALREVDNWIKEINNWQQPVLSADLPLAYKTALFNELYFIVDGGTVWTSGDDSNPIGKFFYLEGHEYLMCNTYDVHFYASFALTMLWPELQLSLQRDFAEATTKEYAKDHWIIAPNIVTKRKVQWAVPHDLGNPGEDPWVLPNAYNLQEIDKWKDLPCKFVLQVYRDYVFTKNRQYLEEMYKVIKEIMHYTIKNFDKNGDGMIENEGFPDQTYDVWSASGCSAYCGGLWVAALKACRAIAFELGDDSGAALYDNQYQLARKVYETLWNGEYFNYDSSNGNHSDSIQSDQMAGNWYSVSCGLGSIIPFEQVRSSLNTIYQKNVKGFAKGKVGALNGVCPNGSVDDSCLQSQEVWAGVTFGLIASMLQAGLTEQAWDVLSGMINTAYNKWGYIYDTPEAWTVEGRYRSKGYMRPLSVWAIQWVLEHPDFLSTDDYTAHIDELKKHPEDKPPKLQDSKEPLEEEKLSKDQNKGLKEGDQVQEKDKGAEE
uniref:NLGase n=1 Tax=Arcella intermedia TaxID=1963864 RepID=A0A6B2KY59_9EUKA